MKGSSFQNLSSPRFNFINSQFPEFQIWIFKSPNLQHFNFHISKFQIFQCVTFKVSSFQNFQITKFQKVRYTYPQHSQNFRFSDAKNIAQGCSHNFFYFLKYFGDKHWAEGPYLVIFLAVSKIYQRVLQSIRNHSFAIFGVIKTLKNPHKYIKKPRKTKPLCFLPYFGPC